MASSEDTTTTGRRARNPVSYTYPDSDDEEEVESPTSTTESSDGNANDDAPKKPTVHRHLYWRNKPARMPTDPEQHNGFQSVDGDNVFYRRYGGSRCVHPWAAEAMERAERLLVAKQDQHSITLNFGSRGVVTQVPYREFYF